MLGIKTPVGEIQVVK